MDYLSTKWSKFPTTARNQHLVPPMVMGREPISLAFPPTHPANPLELPFFLSLLTEAALNE